MNDQHLDYEVQPLDRRPTPEQLFPLALTQWQNSRQKNCNKCELHESARVVCMFGNGPQTGALAVVADHPTEQDEKWGPYSAQSPQWTYLAWIAGSVGVDLRDVYRTYAVRCHVPRDEDREKRTLAAVRECQPYLWRELWAVRPTSVLTLGAGSYYAFTKQKGIAARRGQAFRFTLPCACSTKVCCRGASHITEIVTHDARGVEHESPVTVHTGCLCRGVCHAADEPHEVWVVPSVSPTAVLARPNLHTSFEADVAKWQRLGSGIDATPDVEIIEVRTLDGIQQMLDELNADPTKMLTFDLETRGFQDQRSRYSKVWTAAVTDGTRGPSGIRVFSLPIEHPQAPWFRGVEVLPADQENYEQVRPAVEALASLVLNPERRVNGHNVKFDVRHSVALARRYGQSDPRWRVGFDTILAAHTLDETRVLSLVDQASVALGINNWGKGVQRFGTAVVEDLRDLLKDDSKNGLTELYGPEGMSMYCARDVAYTHALYEVQAQKLRDKPAFTRLLRKLILPGVNAFVNLELNGLYVDQDRLRDHDMKLAARAALLKRQLIEEHLSAELVEHWEAHAVKTTKKGQPTKDFLQNDNFLRDWLFSAKPRGLGFTAVNFTKTGIPQVDEDTLKAFDSPALRVYTEIKKATKGRAFFASWLEWLGDDGRLHASFNLSGTVTGRRSNNNPNLQQVPRDEFIRTVLGAPPGWTFLEVDYSQLEVRLAAWLAGEETMLRIFREGRDIYRETASRFLNKAPEDITYEERRKAKAYVLGFLYGMGPGGFVRYAKDTYDVVVTLEEARELRDLYFETYPGLVRWHERARHKAHEDQEISSPDGRTRHLINIISSDNIERGKAERQAINSPVQGLGADFTMAAIIELLATLDPAKARIVGDVHDAVLFEVREDCWEESARTILSVMENPRAMREIILDWPVRLMAEAQAGTHWKTGPEFSLDDLDHPVKGPKVRAEVAEVMRLGAAA